MDFRFGAGKQLEDRTRHLMDCVIMTRKIGMLKPALLLTTLLFLIMAPEPDGKDIAEMTAFLIVPQNHAVLMAAENRKTAITIPKSY